MTIQQYMVAIYYPTVNEEAAGSHDFIDCLHEMELNGKPVGDMIWVVDMTEVF